MENILFSSWGGAIVDNRGKALENYDPVDHIQLPDYFRQDESIKALMGWNGFVLRSEEVDIIDLCLNYLKAVHDYSKDCGKCNYCKTGFEELMEVLDDIRIGDASEEDMEFIESASEAIVDSSKCSIGKIGPLAFRQALKYFDVDFKKAVAGEKPVTTGVYRSKMTAPCMDACPLHLDIPKYIELIKDAKFDESLEVIRERLPIAGVLGRACFRPCESHCRRANVDEPIAIKHLKRFVADNERIKGKAPDYQPAPSEKTGNVAVVGAGPAGVTCAFHLRRMGHQVTIYEAQEEPGGMGASGIPDYRLPRQILKEEIGQIEQMGVAIKYNHRVGKEITLSQLENQFEAVFIGIGAQESAHLGIEGEDQETEGLFQGLSYLAKINAGVDPHPEGKKIAVIGGGNVAIDCVRSAFRLNKSDVHLLYRRTRDEMPADIAEIRDAEEENVNFHFLTAPVRIVSENGRVVGLECLQMELGESDESGRARPVPVEGSEFVFECDCVVTAIGQQVDLSLLEGFDRIDTTKWHTIGVDDYTKQCAHPKFFCAGDCETGPDALVTACAGGRRAALNIDRIINGKPVEYDDNHYFEKLFSALDVYNPDEEIKKVENKPRSPIEAMPPEERKSTFDEVEKGFSDAEAVAEAERCLKCYQVATIAV